MDKKELKAQAKAQKAQLKAEAKARKAEVKAQKQEAAKQKRIAGRYTMGFNAYMLNGEAGVLKKALSRKEWDLSGATANLIEGHAGSEATKTNSIRGAFKTAMEVQGVQSGLKKNTALLTVEINFPDGDYLEILDQANNVMQARKFVAAVNAVASRGAGEEV